MKRVATSATEIAIARSVQMTSASDVPAKTVEINHYVEKLKEHEALRLSFNERMKYWEEYHKSRFSE